LGVSRELPPAGGGPVVDLLVREGDDRWARGDLAGAKERYLDALYHDPDRYGVLIRLGGLLYEVDEVEEAGATFERCVALKPDDAAARCFLAEIAAERAEDEGDEGGLARAEALFREAIANDPKLSRARFYLAELRLRRGDRAGAIALHEETLAIDPDDEDARRRLGRLRAEGG